MPRTDDKYAIGRLRYLALVEIGLALAILAGTIAFATYDLREKSREQIITQHARVVYAFWLSQKWSEELDTAAGSATAGGGDDEKAADQLTAVLQTALSPQLAGLLGTRLFNPKGRCLFVSDPSFSETTLASADLGELRRLIPVARFHEPAGEVDARVGLIDGAPLTRPLLEVNIPLHSSGQTSLAGVAQFLIDGVDVAAEFRRLDENLFLQSSLTFLAGGGLLGAFLWIGFQQLQRFNRLLAERTQSLLKANQELALAAKTSAVGAVTAHLIHGLKNPLSGLQSFVVSRSADPESGTDDDWQLAISSTRRMQTMIGDIVRVLQDEQGHSQYEMTLEEFAQVLQAKIGPLAREAGVELRCHPPGSGSLHNREANLLSLILHNLAQNAIQATPKGKSVTLTFRSLHNKIECEVRDEGSGISPAQQVSLFKPCQSNKEGGSGIGLAISKQLATCIGADLELKETGPNGTVFILVFASSSAFGKSVCAAENVSNP